jgi:hypothetical protein
VSYFIEIHPPATGQVEALPVAAAKLLLEIFAVLELTPWSAGPLNAGRPDAPVRTIPFGTGGMITYLILEDQQIVDILDIQWIDLSFNHAS